MTAPLTAGLTYSAGEGAANAGGAALLSNPYTAAAAAIAAAAAYAFSPTVRHKVNPIISNGWNKFKSKSPILGGSGFLGEGGMDNSQNSGCFGNGIMDNSQGLMHHLLNSLGQGQQGQSNQQKQNNSNGSIFDFSNTLLPPNSYNPTYIPYSPPPPTPLTPIPPLFTGSRTNTGGNNYGPQ